MKNVLLFACLLVVHNELVFCGVPTRFYSEQSEHYVDILDKVNSTDVEVPVPLEYNSTDTVDKTDTLLTVSPNYTDPDVLPSYNYTDPDVLPSYNYTDAHDLPSYNYTDEIIDEPYISTDSDVSPYYNFTETLTEEQSNSTVPTPVAYNFTETSTEEMHNFVESVTTPVYTTQGPICPGGFTFIGRQCYAYHSSRKSWTEARDVCLRDGGYLAEPRDRSEWILLRDRILEPEEESAWLGGNDMEREGTWVWTTNGQKFSYTDWTGDNPDNDYHGDAENCLQYYEPNNEWNDYKCSKEQAFVCQTRPNIQTTEPDYGEECPDSFVPLYGRRCFMVSESKKTWYKAKSYCHSHGAHLAEPRTTEEYQLLYRTFLLSVGSDVWLGGTDTQSEGDWVWDSDGQSIQINEWTSGNPDNDFHGDPENCLEYNSEDHGINDMKCNHDNYFICEKRLDEPFQPVTMKTTTETLTTEPPTEATTPTTVTPTTTEPEVTTEEADRRCPTNFKFYGNQCYRYVTDVDTWQGAQNTCLRYGGYLAEPSTDEQWNVLRRELLAPRGRSVWLGGSDLEREGVWIWITTGEDFTDTAWMSDNPDNDYHGDAENCLQYYEPNNGWNDYKCSKEQAFVCQTRPNSDGTRTEKTMDCPHLFAPITSTSCYRIFDTSKTWDDAQEECAKHGAHLAQPPTNQEWHVLRRTMLLSSDRPLWLGGRDLQGDGEWIWSDGRKPIEYNAWAASKPTYWGSKNCMEYNHYLRGWTDTKCSYKNHFVCEVRLEEPTPAPVIEESFVIDSGDENLVPSEIRIIEETSDGGEEAVITAEVTPLIGQDNEEVAIGSSTGGESAVFKEGEKEETGNLIITEGQTLVPESEIESTHEEESCPEQFTQRERDCYLLVHNKQTWPEAESSCQMLGGNLASILPGIREGDEDLMDKVKAKARVEFEDVWVGAHTFVGDRWQWAGSEEPVHTKAFRIKPNPRFGCASLRKGKTWQSQDCQMLLYFVCQIPVEHFF